jgi:hypothetical protein
MNRKRLGGKHFSFMWNGIVHLEDGSEWRVVDPAGRHDVTWWQSGELVEFTRHRGALILRNVLRNETVAIVAAGEGMLELAA